MPTILIIDGLRFVIYPNDHRPAHVHIIGKGKEAVFNLNCSRCTPELRENYGFSLKELTKIVDALVANLSELCAKWSEIHGNH